MLTATIDRRARVSLSTTTPGASFVWAKDGLAFATTAAGSVKDQRPNKNYKYDPAQSATETSGVWSNDATAGHRSTGGNARKTTTIGGTVSFSFSGVEFGVCLDRRHDASNRAGTAAQARVDGGAWETINLDSANDLVSMIVWGKSGLANAAHTVEVKLSASPYGLPLVFDGWFYTDRSQALGLPVTYSVTIDGGATETVTVTPNVDRRAVLQALADEMVTRSAAWVGGIPPLTPGHFEVNEWLGGVALLYHVTGREDLRAVADRIYAGYVAAADANGLVTYDGSASDAMKRIVVNGRTGYNYWCAWKVFGDAKWLAVADHVATVLRNTWPKGSYTNSFTGHTFANVWATNLTGTEQVYGGNHHSAACMSLALLYNEPQSTWYQDATVRQRIVDNMAWAIDASYRGANGLLWGSDSPYYSLVYGAFMHGHMAYLARTLGLYVSEEAVTAEWLGKLGMSEPAWYVDDVYTTTPTGDDYFTQVLALTRTGRAVSQADVDVAYSAACAYQSATAGAHPYDPRGVEDGFGDERSVFWDAIAAPMLLVEDVDVTLYAYDRVHALDVPAGADIELHGGAPLVETMPAHSRFPRPHLDAVEVWDGEKYLAGRLTTFMQ